LSGKKSKNRYSYLQWCFLVIRGIAVDADRHGKDSLRTKGTKAEGTTIGHGSNACSPATKEFGNGKVEMISHNAIVFK
jgi:hypothetical protein